MTTSIAFLNDRDVETDFAISVMAMPGWPGNLGSAPRDVPLLEGPEMSGGLIDPRMIRQRPGRASIIGYLDAATAAATLAALDALRTVVSEGEVRVRTAHAPDRQCLATLDTQDGELYTAGLLNGGTLVSLSFVVKDGVALRLQPDGYALSTARTSCPIGTAHSYPVITLSGVAGVTNPSITVRTASGALAFPAMGFTGTIATNDFWLVDCERAAITKSVAGVLSDGMSLWTSGDFPVLRPADGWVEGAAYPSVELSASSGTVRGGISYPRRYR